MTGGLVWLGAGRRRGPLPIAAALLGVQAVLHLVFSAFPGGHHARDAEPGGAAGGHMGMEGMDGVPGPDVPAMADMHMADMHMASMDMSGMDMSGMGMAGMDMSGLAGAHAHDGLGMIAAHVLAGLLCAAWLARGEAAVFRLAAALAAGALHGARPLSRVLALLRTRALGAAPLPAVRRPAAHRRPRTLRGAVHAHTAERRGPPVRGRIRITAPGRPARA
ncbi:hypothetical protein [Streptomyces sp. NPDC054961]